MTTWSYSQAKFAMAMPTERTEAILTGMVEAFGFFRAVPRELWWDNPTMVAAQIFKGRERRLHPRYAALASHYALAAKFCMPASGWEKPAAENSVYDLQRRWATPVPKVRDDDELNAYLRRCCEQELMRTSHGQHETIGVRLEHDRSAADVLPARAFDPCLIANLVTAGLVLGASRLGLPVSTTQVSCSAIFAIGLANGQRHWATIAQIAATWLVTLPMGLVLGAGLMWLLGSR